MKRICSLLLSLFFAVSCNGQNNTQLQEIASKPKTIRTGDTRIIKTQGAQYAGIGCGLQDRSGNLWFCTSGEGVYRYNGKAFTNFLTKDGLSNNTVYSILEDKTGNIWFGTEDGVCRYDGKTFTGIPFAVTNGSNYHSYDSPNNRASVKNTVWCIFQDKNNNIWFGASDGVYRYDGKSFTRFLDNDSVINKNIACILEDKNGNIWFGTGDGVYRYDEKKITKFMVNVGVCQNGVGTMVEDKTGNIWFVSRNRGVCRYDGKSIVNITRERWFE